MYRCESCGRKFNEPGSYKDYRDEYWGVPCWQDIPCCPYCKSDDYYDLTKKRRANIENLKNNRYLKGVRTV